MRHPAVLIQVAKDRLASPVIKAILIGSHLCRSTSAVPGDKPYLIVGEVLTGFRTTSSGGLESL